MQQNRLNRQAIAAGDSPAMPLLSANNLGRRVVGRWLWQQVEFELWPGERVAVVGPSGCGKSLLLRALAGLDSLDAGQVIFANRAMKDWYIPHYRAQVVYLPQRPALLEGTVEDNFKSVFKLKTHAPRRYHRDRVLADLAVLGRGQAFLDQPAAVLSGGETQIVALVRALQLQPPVLLLDEPTASLDPATTQKVEVLIDTWIKAHSGHACLWTSHDSHQLTRTTDRQIILKAVD
jgi:putative ABC transport system ATP-binding protein